MVQKRFTDANKPVMMSEASQICKFRRLTNGASVFRLRDTRKVNSLFQKRNSSLPKTFQSRRINRLMVVGQRAALSLQISCLHGGSATPRLPGCSASCETALGSFFQAFKGCILIA